MKILAADTATMSCSVAVINGDALLAESTVAHNQTHSRHLLKIIDAVLGEAGLQINDLDGFAVSRGPGSFTGLRIGIASIKGLAFALDKPVVGVSSLLALAYQFRLEPYLICPVIDARKQEVYFCRYRSVNGELEPQGAERVASPNRVADGIQEPALFIGSGAALYRRMIDDDLGQFANFVPDNENTIQASAIARLSLGRFKRKETDDVRLLVPHYIRKSDAELSLRGG